MLNPLSTSSEWFFQAAMASKGLGLHSRFTPEKLGLFKVCKRISRDFRIWNNWAAEDWNDDKWAGTSRAYGGAT